MNCKVTSMHETSCMNIPYVILHDKRLKFAANLQNHEPEEVMQQFFKRHRAHGSLERTPHKWYSCAYELYIGTLP